jgi:AcrR family transcriptional regulator
VAETSAQRGREARERMLRAAAELIPEIGWTAVTTRLLATRAGVRPGVVHYHFASVQALLREASVAAISEALDAAAPAIRQAPTPLAALDGFLAQVAQHTGTDPASLLFTETYLAATRDADLRRELSGLLMRFRRQLTELLAAHAEPDPERTAAVVAAAIDGVLLHRMVDPGLDAPTVLPALSRMLPGPRPDQNRETTSCEL